VSANATGDSGRRGWSRTGPRRRFRYLDSRGRRIDDEAKLGRIRRLAIPPAWTDVWISPRANAKLQATGVDTAGRRQYLYHPAFVEEQEQLKWERLVRFGERLPSFRRAVRADLARVALERDRACAAAASLLTEAWLRVGSDQHTRRSGTFGITTLSKRHASVRGRRVRFSFRGKNGVAIDATMLDARLAETVRELLDLPGGARLFRYENGDGRSRVTASTLNAYVKEHLGDEFTAKDFRTWGGTLAAARVLAERGPAESERDEQQALAAAMRAAGRALRNTPTVARNSYVSPAVVEQYRERRTLHDFRPGRNGRSRGGAGLDPEERALLSLLRSFRVRTARAAA